MKKRKFIVSLLSALALCAGLLGVLPAQAAGGDFVVTDGVLLAYYGPGGDVVIPDGVTSIGERVFFRRADVTGVTVPDGVTSIGSDAFYNCANLSRVSLPNTLSSIGRYAFALCYGLTDVTIPDSVVTLGDHAFFECTGLTGVTVPGGVTTIGEYAFYGCDSLTSASIRYGVQKIDYAAFGNCPSLTSLTVPSSVTYMDGATSGLGGTHRFVVYGYNGSAAKTWALSNAWAGAEFVALDGRNPFTDVAEPDYYIDPVIWAVENGVTTGTTATTFSPGQTCSTAQILTFLWRASGEPAANISNPFTDVKESDYYYGAALWAYIMGMVSGGRFDADTPCTRASAVTFIWQAAGSPAASAGTPFTDVPAGAAYAPAVAWAVENGVTTGTGSGAFSPDLTCTRGQIVTFLYRALANG